MRLECFFDYTCGYSLRVSRWLEEQVRPEHPDVDIHWSGFSLKEVNRDGGDSVFESTDEPRLSVLALALGAAARSAGSLDYHSKAFHAFHGPGHRVTRDDLLELAEAAGVDTASFWRDRAVWIRKVGDAHAAAVLRWGVFGTPTLVLHDAAFYLKMQAVPASPAEGTRLWQAIQALVVSHPDVLEIKRVAPVSLSG